MKSDDNRAVQCSTVFYVHSFRPSCCCCFYRTSSLFCFVDFRVRLMMINVVQTTQIVHRKIAINVSCTWVVCAILLFFLFCCRTFSTRTCQLLCRYLERKRSLHSRQCTRINRKAIAEYPHEDEANTKKKISRTCRLFTDRFSLSVGVGLGFVKMQTKFMYISVRINRIDVIVRKSTRCSLYIYVMPVRRYNSVQIFHSFLISLLSPDHVNNNFCI